MSVVYAIIDVDERNTMMTENAVDVEIALNLAKENLSKLIELNLDEPADYDTVRWLEIKLARLKK